MTEAELRALAVSALARVEAAHSGRVRTETRESLGGLADAPDGVRSSSDLVFDSDIPANSSRLETVIGSDYRSVVETVAFPDEGRFYSRVIEVGELDHSALDYPDGVIPAELDDTNNPESELWSIQTPEQYGLSAEALSGRMDNSWLQARLADPAQALRLLGENEERTTLDFWIRGDQFGGAGTPDSDRAEALSLAPEARILVVLVIEKENLVRMTFALPPDTDGHTMLIDSYFWRMGEPVSVRHPQPDECRPVLGPVHTRLASLEPVGSRRWLIFELGGLVYTADYPWFASGDEERPYRPLATGDHLRLTGSTRTPRRSNGATFELWAAATPDGTFIFDRRPGTQPGSHWLERFYEATVDVIDQEVTLAEVVIESENLRLTFADPLQAEDEEVYIEHSASATLAVGEPLVVRVAEFGRSRVITRVEGEDGRVIYDLVAGTGWQ
jgi:hypothetical protein